MNYILHLLIYLDIYIIITLSLGKGAERDERR